MTPARHGIEVAHIGARSSRQSAFQGYNSSSTESCSIQLCQESSGQEHAQDVQHAVQVMALSTAVSNRAGGSRAQQCYGRMGQSRFAKQVWCLDRQQKDLLVIVSGRVQC